MILMTLGACIVFPIIGGMIAARHEKPEDQARFEHISRWN